jgi:hypothetical protein
VVSGTSLLNAIRQRCSGSKAASTRSVATCLSWRWAVIGGRLAEAALLALAGSFQPGP